jgi:hypothetical protein
MACQPALDRRMFRGGVIVQNDVDVLAQRNFDLSSIVSAGLYPSNHHAESAAIKIDLWGQPEGFLKVTSAQHQQLHELQVRKCERRAIREDRTRLRRLRRKQRTRLAEEGFEGCAHGANAVDR